MSRHNAVRCWYCGRKIRWAHCRSRPDPQDHTTGTVIACHRCVSLKGAYTMRQWAAELETWWQWPKWGGPTRLYAIRKAKQWVADHEEDERDET